MSVDVRHGNCLEILPTLGALADSCVTDPPYHLTPMHKRFGAKLAALPRLGTDGAHRRLAAGFMGQQWDGGDVAFQPETWAAVSEALRPGAFLVAFGGTRTVHRLASAIEDAGFIIQDSILDLIATDARVRLFLETLSASQADAFSQILDDLQPTGALAWAFATGFPKRRDHLKPAYEPIVLAYKPGGKRTMQIDECRIGTDIIDTTGADPLRFRTFKEQDGKPRSTFTPNGKVAVGRWPANICHDGSDEVVQHFPYRACGDGTIIRESGADRNGNTGATFGAESRPAGTPTPSYGDEGSAARFFYSAKARSSDRWGSRHPTVKPVELMRWLVALVTPPGGLVLDPFAGSGTTAVAALATGRDAILIEREDQYISDIRERLAFYEGGGLHSMHAKNRSRKTEAGPLFAEPAYNPDHDAMLSYNAAVEAIGERVKAGEPVPDFFRSDKDAAE